MPSNREAYFEAIKIGVPKPVVDFALQEVNSFNYLELTKNFDQEIKNYSLFKESINKYLDGEMIEYVFNKAYFLSQPFYVDSNVLIPRQETEQLVLETEKIIKEMFSANIVVADVCSGSGAIGLSLALRLTNNKYYLSDISKEAIRVSKINAKHMTNVAFLEGDMLTPFIENNIKLDVIVCNPPYIQDIASIDERTYKKEPHLALLANPNTKFYEQLLIDAPKVLNSKHLIAFEIGEDMKDSMERLVRRHCPNDDFYFENDIYGKTRFLLIKSK